METNTLQFGLLKSFVGYEGFVEIFCWLGEKQHKLASVYVHNDTQKSFVQ
jgi:hypothetical protein